jgi:hypothetical protein
LCSRKPRSVAGRAVLVIVSSMADKEGTRRGSGRLPRRRRTERQGANGVPPFDLPTRA